MRYSSRLASRDIVLVAALLAAGVVLAVFSGKASGGTVVGRVDVQAKDRARKPARYHLGAFRSGRASSPRAEGGPQDVVVYLSSPGDGIQVQPTPPPPVMRQQHERFIPHVLPLRVGGSVAFPNADDYYHNVFSLMAGDRFDLGRYGQGDSASQTFTQPGVVVVRCEIHAGMKAYILVLDTPYFTVPDSTGAFRLLDLPEGVHTITAWYPDTGEQHRQIVAGTSDTTSVDFQF
jgi:hypothetical protein